MAILQNRVRTYKKSKTRAIANVFLLPFSSVLSWITFFLILIMLLNSNFLSIQSKIVDFNGVVYTKLINPIEKAIHASVKMAVNLWNFDRIATENALLKLENQNYKKNYAEILLTKIENAKLKDIHNFVEPINPIKNLKASVIYMSSSNNDNLALIQGGSEHGIEENNIVISNGALAGRIVTVGKNYSKVLLVNSYNSRIPVKTETTGLKAILVGNADKGGYLIHLHGRQKPIEGELIVTSGDGNIFPSAIPVGRVSFSEGDDVQVRVLSNFSSADFVEIINPNKQYN